MWRIFDRVASTPEAGVRGSIDAQAASAHRAARAQVDGRSAGRTECKKLVPRMAAPLSASLPLSCGCTAVCPSANDVKRMPSIKALIFDVFGTLVDWRTGIAREARAILSPLGIELDWTTFADAWRSQYQPAMDQVRSGRLPFSKLDVLHRRNLEIVLMDFGLGDVAEPARAQ